LASPSAQRSACGAPARCTFAHTLSPLYTSAMSRQSAASLASAQHEPASGSHSRQCSSTEAAAGVLPASGSLFAVDAPVVSTQCVCTPAQERRE
jgi:hypothetical protein